MQKNKFIHEDIKAVCSSAAKKLVAMGLVAAVGGPYTVGYDNRLIASAQDFKNTISGNGNTLISGNGDTHISGGGDTHISGGGNTEVYGDGNTEVYGDGNTEVYGDGNTEVHGHGATEVYGIGPTTIHGDGDVVMKGNGNLQMRGGGNAELHTLGTVRTCNSFLTTVDSPAGVVSAQRAKRVNIQRAEHVNIESASHIHIQSVDPGSANVNSPNGVASDQNTTSAPRSCSSPDCVVEADRYKLVDIHGPCDVRLGISPSTQRPMKSYEFSKNYPHAIIKDNRAVRIDGTGPVLISSKGDPVMLKDFRYGWCYGDGDIPWYVYGKRPVVIPESASVKIDHRGGQVSDEQAEIYVAYPPSDGQPRDVIVNRANSLTVAAEVPIRMQNHTEFRMGATMPETAENILQALPPNLLRNVLNRFTNQNTTNDEMKEEREERDTNNAKSSKGGGFFSKFDPFTWFGGSE